MMAFLIDYWIAAVPTVLTGAFLLGVMKKLRDEKAAKKAPRSVPVPARRR